MRWRSGNNRRRSADRKYRKRLEIAKKTSRLGLSYGMSMKRMAEGLSKLSISYKDAEEAVKSFRRNYARWLRFHSAVSGRMTMHMDGSITTKRWPGFREDEPK